MIFSNAGSAQTLSKRLMLRWLILTMNTVQAAASGERAVRPKVLDIEEIKALQAKREAARAA